MAVFLLTQILVLIPLTFADDLQSSILSGNNAFGLDISTISYEDSSTNIWISPFSISFCVALLYPGSEGVTKSEIAEVMGYPTDSASDKVTESFFNLSSSIETIYDGTKLWDSQWSPTRTMIGIANKIYVANDLVLKQSYIDALDDENDSFIEYDFDFKSTDAAQTINDWVDDNTNGLIDKIMEDKKDISEWKLAALSAIYLNATFQKQFESYVTSKNSFYDSLLRDTVVSECHLMHQIDDFYYFEDGHYQWLKFPFNDDHDLFALFALPMNPEVYSVGNGLITDWNVIDSAINHLQSTYVALALPKLSVEAKYNLKESLQELGMVQAFTALADFSGMSNTSLMVDSIVHKTMIEMDENGLVAAAVTMGNMVLTSIGAPKPRPILFKADHSFQMFIIDGEHENAVLFMGQINNPGIPDGSDEPTFVESSSPVWDDTRVFNNTDAPVAGDTILVTEAPVRSNSNGQYRLSMSFGAFCLSLATFWLTC